MMQLKCECGEDLPAAHICDYNPEEPELYEKYFCDFCNKSGSFHA